MLRVIAIAVSITALAPGVARGAPWHWPVTGRVVASFFVTPDHPYASGQRRGITIVASPGTPVRAACAGRVAFAGPIGRSGPTASVECGGLRATYQGLASVAVEASMPARAGDTIGHVGAAGLLRFGARENAGRSSSAGGGPARYVDPVTLFGRSPRRPSPAPTAPRLFRPVRVPSGAPPAPSSLPLTTLGRRPGWLPADIPAHHLPDPARAPLLAWLGLAAFLLAVPVGTLRVRLRRRIRRSGAHPAPRAAARSVR